MSPHNLKIYGLMLAQLAYIEGMKAENAQRERRGESMAYDEKPFADCGNELTRLAGCVDTEVPFIPPVGT